MGKFDSLMIETPSMTVENLVLSQVEKPLQELRKRKQRAQFFQWLTVPAVASLVGVMYFRNRSQVIPDEAPTSVDEQMFAVIAAEEIDNLDLIADLDLLENLEDLEAWEES